MSTLSSSQCLGPKKLMAIVAVWFLVLSLPLVLYKSHPYKDVQNVQIVVFPNASGTTYPAWPPTREMLSLIADEQGRVTVVGVNFGYIDMFYNWARSATNVGLNNIVIVALDDKTYQVLQSRFPERTLLPSFKVESGFAEFGSVKFKKLTHTRPSFIRAIVDLGFPVFYIDTDTIMRRNPYQDIERALMQEPNTTMMVSEDGIPGYYCSCMLHFSCDESSRSVLKAWETECLNTPDYDDQHALNVVIAEYSILERFHLFVIPESAFPSGKRTFIKGYDWHRFPDGPTIVHANYMIGHDKKMKALQDRAAWDHKRILPVLYNDIEPARFY